MSTSIKNVSSKEAKSRIKELFGDISSSDIAVVNLSDDKLQANQTTTSKLNSEVRMAGVQDVRKAIEIKLNRNISSNDVSVVRLNDNTTNTQDVQTSGAFKVSTGSVQELHEKLSASGFEFDGTNVAVVTAQSLGLQGNNTNNNKKFKK